MRVKHLLAIDLGHRSGFAVYDEYGHLVRYWSTNFGSASRMKKAAWGILSDVDGLSWVVAEGDRNLAHVWEKTAVKMDAEFILTNAEEWRDELLLKRQRRSGRKAKETADVLARQVIDWSDASRPTSLRHDAAEAILIGLWGAVEVDLLAAAQVERILG